MALGPAVQQSSGQGPPRERAQRSRKSANPMPATPGLAATPGEERGRMARRRAPLEPPVKTVARVPTPQAATKPANSRRPPRSVSAVWLEGGREASPGVLQRPSPAQGSEPPLLPVVSATGRGQREALRALAWGPASVARRAGPVVTPQAPAEALALALMEALHRLAARPVDRAATPPLSVALARGAAEPGTVATRDGAARALAADQTRPLAWRRTAEPLAPVDPLAPAPRLPPARLPRGPRGKPSMAVRGEGRRWRRRA